MLLYKLKNFEINKYYKLHILLNLKMTAAAREPSMLSMVKSEAAAADAAVAAPLTLTRGRSSSKMVTPDWEPSSEEGV